MLDANLPDSNFLGSSSPDGDLSETELLKSLLDPLLDDFEYWFERSQALLSDHEMDFLDAQAQADILARVVQAKEEVKAARSLFRAIGSQVGVDPAVMAIWHRLVAECWQVASRYRASQQSG
jgi:phosphatidylinositol kinase/protein kinase (PI-3  family)